MRKERKRIMISLTDERQKWLDEMRAEDYQLEMPEATYISDMIRREKKRRDEEKAKKSPGRPKKEDGQNENEPEELVPHPSKILADQGVMIPKSEAEAMNVHNGTI